LQEHLIQLLIHDDNPFSREAEKRSINELDPILKKAVEQDLAIFYGIFHLDINILAKKIGVNPDIIPWKMHVDKANSESIVYNLYSSSDWTNNIRELIEH
jgi:hypothetical protein